MRFVKEGRDFVKAGGGASTPLRPHNEALLSMASLTIIIMATTLLLVDQVEPVR